MFLFSVIIILLSLNITKIFVSSSYIPFSSSLIINYEEYFKDLDNIINDLHQPLYAFNPKIYQSSFTIAINTLTTERLCAILEENDATVIDQVLKEGIHLISNFTEKISLNLIPLALLESFPIEYLDPVDLSVIDINLLSQVVTKRTEMGLILFENILKIPDLFWENTHVKLDIPFLLNFSAFHLGDLGEYLSKTENLGVQQSYENITSFVFSHCVPAILETLSLIVPDKRSEIHNALTHLIFVLQTFIHQNLESDEMVQYKLAVKSIGRIKDAINIRSQAFPNEKRFIYNLRKAVNNCYSFKIAAKVGTPLYESIFFDQVSVVPVGAAKAIELFQCGGSYGFDSIDPNMLLMIFMINASGPESMTSLIDYIAWDLTNVGRLMRPFYITSKLINSLSECLKKTLQITFKIEFAFTGSPFARIHDILVMRCVLRNDFCFLLNFKSDSELNYSSVFLNAFATRSNSPELESRTAEYEENLSISFDESKRNDYTQGGASIDGDTTPTTSNESFRQLFIFRNMIEFPEFESRPAFLHHCGLFSNSALPNLRIASIGRAKFHVLPSNWSPPIGADDYIYVNYFISGRRSAMPGELNFVSVISSSIIETIHDVSLIIKFVNISSDRHSALFDLKAIYTSFGDIIASPRMKTLEYKNGDVNGHYPVPFLCPKVLGILGAWTALRLKHRVGTSWRFAPVYLDFLFGTEEEANVDELVEIIYSSLFDQVISIFESDQVGILPRLFKPHRMFDCGQIKGQPFLMEEPFYLLSQQSSSNFLEACSASCANRGVKFYLSVLKSSLRKNLISGKREFLTVFKLFFRKEFLEAVPTSILKSFINESSL